MNAFSVTGLFFVAFPCAVLAVLTLLKKRRMVHLMWTLFLVSVVVWGIGMFKIGGSKTEAESLFWWRFAEIGVILIPVFLNHFVIAFLELKRKIVLVLSYLIGGMFLYLDIFTDYLIHDLYFAFNEFYYIQDTPFYSALIAFFVLSVIYVIYELNRVYEKTSGIKRVQVKYLILAFFIGFSGGVTSYPPVYGISEIYPIWNGTIFIGALMISYAMLKYRLMDIRIAIRKVVFYIITAGFAYGFFYLLVWFYPRFFGGFYTSKTYASGIVVAILFVIFSALLNKWVRRITNKYLFFSLYSYQYTINKLIKELNYSIDLDKIIDSIVDTIKNTMQLDRAGVLIVKKEKNTIHYKIAKVIGFNEDNGISLVQDNFLTRYLEKIKRPLVAEEMIILSKDSDKPSDKRNFANLSHNMKTIEASLCLPLISRDRLMGIIVLGSKLSGDAYSKEDLELLDILSRQAAIAIENARLYDQVQNFNKTLQQKVDEQTQEIKQQKEKVEQSYEVEKKARVELERLDRAKDQFVLASQHHLRTPVSGMSGYLDLIFTGTFGKIPKKLEGALLKFQSATKILSRLIDEFLDISQFQLGRKVVAPTPDVELIPILEDILESVKAEADKKGLSIKLEKDKLPKITVDAEKLKTALYNVIDNAVKYTNKGKILVKANLKDNNVLIEVKDTGKGLSKQEMKLLFDKLFERGDKAEKFYATGRGIGLFMATLIIEAHNGKIWAESQGQDKGSSFFIQLPIK